MKQIGNLKQFIFEIRGMQVMLDSDLALCYGIETKKLNQAVKRNIERFPEDFMFQLTEQEYEILRRQIGTSNEESGSLRSQIVTSKTGRGGRQYLPYAFTEQGVAMLSGVINSPAAIQVNINIMRTFTAMRKYFADHKNIGAEVKKLEQMLLLHIDSTDGHLENHTEKINSIIEALNEMRKLPPAPPKQKIGFRP